MSARRLIVVLLVIAAGAIGARSGALLDATREKARHIGIDTPVLWSRRVHAEHARRADCAIRPPYRNDPFGWLR